MFGKALSLAMFLLRVCCCEPAAEARREWEEHIHGKDMFEVVPQVP